MPPDLAPKVSVVLLTYNHERYIREALESVREGVQGLVAGRGKAKKGSGGGSLLGLSQSPDVGPGHALGGLAGVAVGHHAVVHLGAGPGEAGDRPGRAEVHVVRVSRDHERPLRHRRCRADVHARDRDHGQQAMDRACESGRPPG